MSMNKSEAGYRGYLVTEARYGTKQMNKWRRMGGRKPNLTLAEVKAQMRTTKGATGPLATEVIQAKGGYLE